MRIGLHDADATTFPNLALMKLSAYHKAQGDEVELVTPDGEYDLVFSSKVFGFTPDPPDLPHPTIYGGAARDLTLTLPDEIEHCCPDYSLYALTYSIGFLTRGCIRTCPWCLVPRKEGKVHAHADIDEFLRHPYALLIDNNVLSHPHGTAQLEKISHLKVKVDFNQGLDARLIDYPTAKLLSRVYWWKPIRLACDTLSSITPVADAVRLLRWHNTSPVHYFCYVLAKDIPSALERVQFLKGIYVDPFVQPYRDIDNPQPPSWEMKCFARWVNQKIVFKLFTWEEYFAECQRTGKINPF